MNVRYNSNLAFVDLLFNLILGFAFLFIVAFFLINDPTEDKDVEAKVEYMIIMDWDGDRDIDMDLWVQSPSGLIGFRSPNIGFVNLEPLFLSIYKNRISVLLVSEPGSGISL